MVARAKGVNPIDYRSELLRSLVRDDWIEWARSVRDGPPITPHKAPPVAAKPAMPVEVQDTIGKDERFGIWIRKMAIRAKVGEADLVRIALKEWAERKGVEPPPN